MPQNLVCPKLSHTSKSIVDARTSTFTGCNKFPSPIQDNARGGLAVSQDSPHHPEIKRPPFSPLVEAMWDLRNMVLRIAGFLPRSNKNPTPQISTEAREGSWTSPSPGSNETTAPPQRGVRRNQGKQKV